MSWEGYGVSVRCGALGCYQGTILAAGGDSITLTKPFRNGFPYPKAQVTLKASDIKSLEIISERAGAAPAHSTVLAGGKRRGPRAPVGESLQPPQPPALPAPPAPPTPSGGAGGAGRARSKPVDIQGARPARSHAHSGAGSGGAGATGGAGGAGSAARRRNEACFGAGALEDVAQEFDFEGNLALFDKEALWQQMRPDVVRVAAARDALAAGGRLRPDQSVLARAPPDTEPVHVPLELRGPVWYVTDGGVRVPSLSACARRRAWRALAADGAAGPARALLARAAADVALRLVGGGRRLDPRNAHQRPAAAVAVRAGEAAAAAVEAARILQSHGVDTFVVAPAAEAATAGAGATATARCARVAEALARYAAAGGCVLAPRAPRPPADLLLLALADPAAGDALDEYGEEIVEWALSTRGALVLLEPGGGDGDGDGDGHAWARAAGAARAAVLALLPGALPAPAPRLLLANVAPPPALLRALGLRYRPPFGAAALLPLYPAED